MLEGVKIRLKYLISPGKKKKIFYLFVVLKSSDQESLSKPRNVVLISNNYSMQSVVL